jgi:hypothetical protein
MVHKDTEVPVLARFPDVNDTTSDHRAHTTKGVGLLASTGRLIGQATSIKLLAGTALFLIVGAVLPFCIGKSPPANLSPAGDSLTEMQPNSSGATPETTPDAGEAAALIAGRPAVRVIATKEPSSAPAAIPPSAEANGKLQAGSASEASLSSRWPTPAPAELQSPNVGGPTLQPGVNQPAAVRQAEYEADARTGATPGNDRDTRR